MNIQKLFDLTGRTALVTGSSRGLGLQLARGLGSAGARILVNGTNTERMDAAVEKLRAEGIDADPCPFDVRDEAAIDRAVSAAGTIDILVNNAGIQYRSPVTEFPTEEWKKVLDVNLTGPFLVARRVAQDMVERKSGKIINMCSMASEICRETTAAYSAAKGGLKLLTRSLCVDLARYGIQVNGIGPGYFITEMTQPLADDPEFDTWIRGRTPAARWGKTEELMGAAVLLASDASSFINGQVIYVDGGMLSVI